MDLPYGAESELIDNRETFMNTSTVTDIRNQHATEQAQLSVELYHLDTRIDIVRGRLKELAVIMQTVEVLASQDKTDNETNQ